MKKPLSRRHVLKGLGTAISLPMLDAMIPTFARAQVAPAKNLLIATFPNGTNMSDWIPSAVGSTYTLPYSLEPLAALKSDVLVTSGVDLNIPYISSPNTDHTAPNFTTCSMPQFTGGNLDVKNPSIDQVIGQGLNVPVLSVGNQSNASIEEKYYGWKTRGSPADSFFSPLNLFNNLTAGGTATQTQTQQQNRLNYKKSILDFVLDDATRLSATLGSEDKARLDEYLTSMRKIERQISATSTTATAPTCTQIAQPAASEDFQTRVALFWDLIFMAMQCGKYRIVNFGLDKEGSDQSYGFIGLSYSHHEMSHGNGAGNQGCAQVARWHVERMAAFLTKMKNAPDGMGGSLLDNTLAIMGSQLSQTSGDHWHKDLPVVMAGKLGGAVRPGRHLRLSSSASYYKTHDNKGTNLANIYLAIAKAMGVNLGSFADSNGVAVLS